MEPMTHRLMAFLGVLAVGGRGAEAPAGASAPPARAVWISDIRTPVKVNRDRLLDFARRVFEAVRRGETGGEFAAGLVPGDDPQAIFLSVRPRSAKKGAAIRVLPARAFLGTGNGIVAAVRDALTRLASERKRIGPVQELKVDLVRYVLRGPDLVPRGALVPFPGLAGLAFAPRTGIAFVPEQLLGRSLLDAGGRLRVHAVEALLTAERRWADLRFWSRLQSFPAAQPNWRFECTSIYVDEAGAIPLLRGHRIIEDVAADVLLDHALVLGKLLAQGCSPSGALEFDVPGWSSPPRDRVRRRPNAIFALALLRLAGAARQAGRPETEAAPVLVAAGRALDRNLRRTRPYRAVPGAVCVVATDRSSLETNALTVLALLEARRVRPTLVGSDALEPLGRYLLGQLQPDGSLVMERYYPSGNIRGVDLSLNASGLAILAMLGLYESTGSRLYLSAASRAMLYLLEHHYEKKSMGELSPVPGVAAALNEIFTVTRDPRCIRQAQRIGLAAVVRQNRAPEALDLFGGCRDDPTLSTSARRTRVLLSAAELLEDRHKTRAAAELLSAAGLGLMYELTGCMDAPATLYIEAPDKVRGFFREDLSACQFTFEGQIQQVLTLVKAWRFLREYDKPGLVLTPADRELLRRRRERIGRFPRVLTSAALSAAIADTGSAPKAGPVVRPIPKTAPE